jgi:hypothetical protein
MTKNPAAVKLGWLSGLNGGKVPVAKLKAENRKEWTIRSRRRGCLCPLAREFFPPIKKAPRDLKAMDASRAVRRAILCS